MVAPITRQRLQQAAVPLALFLLAAGIRLYGINWGLPGGHEEATPLRKAWEMWHWGQGKGPDFNPHFFNYPSLTIYIQFVIQGLLYLGKTITGAVQSAVDYHVLYELDKTPFFLAGRLVNVLFGSATIALVYVVGKRIGGTIAAVSAALWLTASTAHISRSQMIEVDVPLAFFTLLALWLMIRAVEGGTIRDFVFAGIAVGLAASTKYTGALLAPAIVVAYWFASVRRTAGTPKLTLRAPAFALAAMVLAFAATSPYVFLDFSTFLDHLSLEREHMRIGHFGGADSPAWLFYLKQLTGQLLGWPLTLISLGGLVYFAAIRRKWAILFFLLIVPYLIRISTWEMRVSRYLMPVLPLLLLTAAAALATLARNSRVMRLPTRTQIPLVAGAVALLAIPLLTQFPGHLQRALPDPQTLATIWVNSNVPSGSFIVSEHYGPDLFGVPRLNRLTPAIQKKVIEQLGKPVYAVQDILMFQTRPWRSRVFYDVSLYRDADYVITTSTVRSRYERAPKQYPGQVTFYKNLETGFEEVIRFAPESGDGTTITIYRNPRQTVPFARREAVSGPGRPLPGDKEFTANEPNFYLWFGTNYEWFRFHEGALNCYRSGLLYPLESVDVARKLVLGATRCLLNLGRGDQAIEILDKGMAVIPSEWVREELARVRQRIINQLRDSKEQ